MAVRKLGWSCRWLAEIDQFAATVLARHYPEIPNVGDITAVDPFRLADHGAVDVIVGGTPCQSFSVQGARRGMDDDRGRLALRFGEIVAACQPSWVVWENVPGILAANSGRDFGGFLDQMGDRGYSLAWRVLDAQHFGVAQQRRRLFVVGHRRRFECAAGVLFDLCTGREDEAETEEVQAELQVAGSVRRRTGGTGDETPKLMLDRTPTLRAQQGGEGVVMTAADGCLRKLTATEWERLQGLPDGYTAIAGASEATRRRAIGNGMAVPVMRWIAERMQFVHQLEDHDA